MTGTRRPPRIVLAADHGGVEMKTDLIRFLSGMGYEVRDLGTATTDPVDYPDYGFAAAAAIRGGDADRAILICKSGIGMAIAANKACGVRAALVSTVRDAELSRRHNDANVLVLGALEIALRRARRIARAWLATPFDGGRHRRRVDKIRAFEKAHWRD
ncbi:MAG TPA: ribose 5-phosphate isomerase B [Candidatus Aquicultoraceae bacterium]|nr:ribose 5-phosphate isomerase B [Candidatus Aquicultoraceae bacterium]